MISETTDSFWEHLDRLPRSVRRQAEASFQRFQENPYQRGLYFKQVRARRALYSVRIGDHYRALAIVERGRAMVLGRLSRRV